MYPPPNEITVSLREPELWKKILSLGTEIPVKPTGKLMFPLLNYNVSGLDPEGVYTMGIKLRRVNKNILEFKKNKIPNKWRETGQPVEHFPLESNEIFETPKRDVSQHPLQICSNSDNLQNKKREEAAAQAIRLRRNPNEEVRRFETIDKNNLKRPLSDNESISSDSTFFSIDSFSTSKQNVAKTVDSTSMTTSCYNETFMKISSKSIEVLLDMSTAAFRQDCSTSKRDHHLSGATQTSQVPTTRYTDGLEQYLLKDPVSRMEFERSDLDDILIGLLLENIHTGTSHQKLCQDGNNMNVVSNTMSCQH
ncbi:hypothetical protein CRE_21042 [Caenorhabditis remanei]|uniref:T-box domain-containing protein n=1 Tax=Caenorhabditis remanei TaxID=31234 RepID=E3NNR4_CAERE|nr:hypothetical protein CRE_21042 [Caenorhabditis remanei]